MNICTRCGCEIDDAISVCPGCISEYRGDTRIIREPTCTWAEDTVASLKYRLERMSINFKWLLQKMDEAHKLACPEYSGTWQQRAEQLVSEVAKVRVGCHLLETAAKLKQ